MSLCPHCGADVRANVKKFHALLSGGGASTCGECGGALEHARHEDAPVLVERIDWVKAVGAPHPVAGVMLMGVLEAAEIPARLEERSIPAYGAIPSSWNEDAWGIIYVPAEYAAEAAREIEAYLKALDLAPHSE